MKVFYYLVLTCIFVCLEAILQYYYRGYTWSIISSCSLQYSMDKMVLKIEFRAPAFEVCLLSCFLAGNIVIPFQMFLSLSSTLYYNLECVCMLFILLHRKSFVNKSEISCSDSELPNGQEIIWKM